jgi:hypothetical protein
MRWRPCESRQDGFGKRNDPLALGVWRTTNDKRYFGSRVPGSEVISGFWDIVEQRTLNVKRRSAQDLNLYFYGSEFGEAAHVIARKL